MLGEGPLMQAYIIMHFVGSIADDMCRISGILQKCSYHACSHFFHIKVMNHPIHTQFLTRVGLNQPALIPTTLVAFAFLRRCKLKKELCECDNYNQSYLFSNMLPNSLDVCEQGSELGSI